MWACNQCGGMGCPHVWVMVWKIKCIGNQLTVTGSRSRRYRKPVAYRGNHVIAYRWSDPVKQHTTGLDPPLQPLVGFGRCCEEN